MVGEERGGILVAALAERREGALVVSVFSGCGPFEAPEEKRAGVLRALLAAVPQGVPLVRYIGPKSDAERWAGFPEIRAIGRPDR